MMAFVSKNLAAFCSQTGMHGFAYLPAKRNRLELGFWAIIVAVACSFALYYSTVSLMAFYEDPVEFKVSHHMRNFFSHA